MLFFVFGLPGGLSAWCERVVAELARRAGGGADLIRGDTLEQIAAGAIAAGVSQGVVSSRQPGGRLRAAVLEKRAHFVVALDDPRAVLIELVLGRGVPLPDAVQQLASSCAALRGLPAEPGALALQGPPGVDAIIGMAHHLGLVLDDRDLADLAAAAAPTEIFQPPPQAVSWWNSLDLAEQELALGALAPFIDDRADDAPFGVSWGRELFFIGDRPRERAIGPIDITGRARCLVHGPHVVLPAGSWSLALTALFSPEAAEYEFLAEVWADRVLAEGVLQPQEGSAALMLDFVLGEETEQPVTIRVSSRRAAFDGAIEAIEARLVREPPAPGLAPAGR